MKHATFNKRLWHGIRLRKRLVIAALLGVGVWLLLPNGLRPSTRALIGWNTLTLTYLVTSWIQMLRAEVTSLRRRAAEQDEAEWIVLALAIVATLVSLAAIVVELQGNGAAGDGKLPPSHLALAGLTIVTSWLFMHTLITLHYARLFYGTGEKPAGGLLFPGEDEPDYADFLYFSLTIGAAAQTSDVAITSRTMRRVVLVQTILAFFFNTTVLALAINIGAGLL